ncbi:hypothetical protein Tco_0872000 [Tanacetum coccineum]
MVRDTKISSWWNIDYSDVNSYEEWRVWLVYIRIQSKLKGVLEGVYYGSGYQQKDRKPSQNDKTEHGMEKTVQNQGQSPKMSKSESIPTNQQSNPLHNLIGLEKAQ